MASGEALLSGIETVSRLQDRQGSTKQSPTWKVNCHAQLSGSRGFDRKDASLSTHLAIAEKSLMERRGFERVVLPATALAFDTEGHELGRVADISGGGLLLEPASPWARVALAKGQKLVVTIVEPSSSNNTEMNVEVRYIHSRTIGLRFA